MSEYRIIDWAGNVLFHGKTFASFEEGWDYLYNLKLNEDDYEEYAVELCEVREANYLDPKEPTTLKTRF